MGIKQRADKILAEIALNQGVLNEFNTLFRAYNGNIDQAFENRLAFIKSSQAKRDFRAFKSSDNVFKQTVEKQSIIYTMEIERLFTKNQELYDWYIKVLNINTVLQKASELVNATGACFLELKLNKKLGIPKLVAVPNDRIWVTSEDCEDPTNPSTFVKIVKELELSVEDAKIFSHGVRYIIYTEEEIYGLDCYFPRDTKKPNKKVWTDQEANDWGFVPLIYVNRDDFNIIPEINSEDRDIVINPTLQMTSGQIASWYQSNPMRVFKNVDTKKLKKDLNPGSFISIQAPEGSDKDPDFKIYPSTLDLKAQSDFIQFQTDNYRMNKHVPKAKDATTNKSGTALRAEGEDTIEFRKRMINLWTEAEFMLWNKVPLFHNWLISHANSKLNMDMPRTAFKEGLILPEITFEFPSVASEQENDIRDNSQGDNDGSKETKKSGSKEESKWAK